MRNYLKSVGLLIEAYKNKDRNFEALITILESKDSETKRNIERILKLSVPDVIKYKLLNDESSLKDAERIFAIDKRFEKFNITSESFRSKILIDPLLRTYSGYLLNESEEMKKRREHVGINSKVGLINHLILSNKEGNTLGCGCKICEFKNKMFISQLKLKSYLAELKKLNSLKDLLGLNGNKRELPMDPFANEFFNKFCSVYGKEAVKGVYKNSPYHSRPKDETLIARFIYSKNKQIKIAEFRIHQNEKHLTSLYNLAKEDVERYKLGWQKLAKAINSPY